MSRYYANNPQPDPAYFSFGNAFLGGVQQAQNNQRQNALLDMEKQQFGMQQQRFAMDQDQYVRGIQADQAAGQQAASEREALASLLESEGLPVEWANLPRDQLADMLERHEESQKPAMPEYKVVGDQLLQLGPDGVKVAHTAPQRGPSQGAPPSGYRWTPEGALEAIPGGPNDPKGPNSRKGSQPLRKEFRQLPSVKAYEEVLPLIQSAAKAPDTGYGDLQLIYTVGKALDPGSVVREGELALTIAAGSPLQRIIGATRFSTEQGGRLPPESRRQIMEMLKERVSAYKQAYDRDFSQYSEYAIEQNYDPSLIVGEHADTAYGGKKGGAPKKAIEALKQNPALKEQFKAKYGYLPDGI